MGVHPGRNGGRGVVLIPWTNVMTDQALGGQGSMLIASVFLQPGVSAVMQLTPRAGLELSLFQLAGLVPLTRTA